MLRFTNCNSTVAFSGGGQHLGFDENSSMLRKHLVHYQLKPEACSFRLVALDSLEQESEAVERAEHDKRRDVVAAMDTPHGGSIHPIWLSSQLDQR